MLNVVIFLPPPYLKNLYIGFFQLILSPAKIYYFKVNNENTRAMRSLSGVFIVNFKRISHIVLVFDRRLYTSKCRLEHYSEN